MKKRVGFAYTSSVVLALIAFAVLMTRLLGPSTRWASGSIYALSWVLLVYALRRHARARGGVHRGARWLKYVWDTWYQELTTAAALLLIGSLAFTLMPPDDAPFLIVHDDEVREQVAADLVRAERAARGIERQTATLIALIESSEPTDLRAARQLRAAWASYLDYAIELDQLIDLHEHFYQINAVTLEEERATSFLIAFVSLSQQLNSGFALRSAVKADLQLRTLLDEPCVEESYDQGAYFALAQGLTRGDSLLRLEAGLGYYALLRSRGYFRAGPATVLADQARERAVAALAAAGRNADAWVDNPLNYFETKAFAAWFPLQKKVATGLGDLRVKHRDNFVQLDDLERLQAQLEPMDIFLERRNWYATNVGLPGFWPHAALYVGHPDRLDAYFDTELVEAETGYPSLSAFLEHERASVWQAWATTDPNGDGMRMLEAVSEGVVFQTLEHSGRADYLAVLRPKLDREQKLSALLRALEYHERPYDFDFDFVTDSSLVCSELVYKSLEGLGDIHFELAQTSGRWVLTPNQIVKKFDTEFNQSNSSLEFVAFFDGNEQEQRAFERDAATLRTSWKRPKWDLVQP